MPHRTPDRDYLDAFLQGARFALFAVEARMRDNGAEPAEIEATLDEFHDLFRSVRDGMSDQALVKLAADPRGKN